MPPQRSYRLRRRGPLQTLQTAWVAIALTWIGGYVDVVGYLSIYGLYTANMSGNTVSFARHVVGSNRHGVALYGWTLVSFVFGLIVGGMIFEAQRRRAVRTRIPLTVALEILLMGFFIAMRRRTPSTSSITFFGAIALLAIAMGVQNVTIRRVGGLNIYTTFVTGTLVKFGEAISSYLFWLNDHLRNVRHSRFGRIIRLSCRQPSMHHALLTAALWISYFVGAISGDLAIAQFHNRSLLFPLALLCALGAYATVSPPALIEQDW